MAQMTNFVQGFNSGDSAQNREAMLIVLLELQQAMDKMDMKKKAAKRAAGSADEEAGAKKSRKINNSDFIADERGALVPKNEATLAIMLKAFEMKKSDVELAVWKAKKDIEVQREEDERIARKTAEEFEAKRKELELQRQEDERIARKTAEEFEAKRKEDERIARKTAEELEAKRQELELKKQEDARIARKLSEETRLKEEANQQELQARKLQQEARMQELDREFEAQKRERDLLMEKKTTKLAKIDVDDETGTAEIRLKTKLAEADIEIARKQTAGEIERKQQLSKADIGIKSDESTATINHKLALMRAVDAEQKKLNIIHDMGPAQSNIVEYNGALHVTVLTAFTKKETAFKMNNKVEKEQFLRRAGSKAVTLYKTKYSKEPELYTMERGFKVHLYLVNDNGLVDEALGNAFRELRCGGQQGTLNFGGQASTQ
jgi:hypothetical protein